MNAEERDRLTQVEDRAKSNSIRLNEVEAEVKENRELTVAVKEIATEMKHLREEQTDMNNRLKLIEEKPLQEYENTKKDIKKQVISFAIGLALCYFAMKLGLGNYI